MEWRRYGGHLAIATVFQNKGKKVMFTEGKSDNAALSYQREKEIFLFRIRVQ